MHSCRTLNEALAYHLDRRSSNGAMATGIGRSLPKNVSPGVLKGVRLDYC